MKRLLAKRIPQNLAYHGARAFGSSAYSTVLAIEPDVFVYQVGGFASGVAFCSFLNKYFAQRVPPKIAEIKMRKQFIEGGFKDKMDMEEAYSILALPTNAKRADVLERYRVLMKANHPDLGGSPYISAKVNEAKDFLSLTLPRR